MKLYVEKYDVVEQVALLILFQKKIFAILEIRAIGMKEWKLMYLAKMLQCY